MGISIHSSGGGYTGLVFPFYNAAGTLDSIALNGYGQLPFFNSSGVADNITLTT